MKKRNKLKPFSKHKIIIISLIISMGMIGVGYADSNDGSSIKFFTDNKNKRKLYDLDKDLNYLKININPNNNRNDNIGLTKSDVVDVNFSDGNSSSLEDEIDTLKEKISKYEKGDKFDFNYIITYELGDDSWKKDLSIEGDIKVVPDPEILDHMNAKLEKLQLKLGEKIKIEEQQKALATKQMLSETQKQPEEGNTEQIMEDVSDDINEDKNAELNKLNNEINLNSLETENINNSNEGADINLQFDEVISPKKEVNKESSHETREVQDIIDGKQEDSALEIKNDSENTDSDYKSDIKE